MTSEHSPPAHGIETSHGALGLGFYHAGFREPIAEFNIFGFRGVMLFYQHEWPGHHLTLKQWPRRWPLTSLRHILKFVKMKSKDMRDLLKSPEAPTHLEAEGSTFQCMHSTDWGYIGGRRKQLQCMPWRACVMLPLLWARSCICKPQSPVPELHLRCDRYRRVESLSGAWLPWFRFCAASVFQFCCVHVVAELNKTSA